MHMYVGIYMYTRYIWTLWPLIFECLHTNGITFVFIYVYTNKKIHSGGHMTYIDVYLKRSHMNAYMIRYKLLQILYLKKNVSNPLPTVSVFIWPPSASHLHHICPIHPIRSGSGWDSHTRSAHVHSHSQQEHTHSYTRVLVHKHVCMYSSRASYLARKGRQRSDDHANAFCRAH